MLYCYITIRQYITIFRNTSGATNQYDKTQSCCSSIAYFQTIILYIEMENAFNKKEKTILENNEKHESTIPAPSLDGNEVITDKDN